MSAAAATDDPPVTATLLSIGAAARRFDVSTRTLRYYQEIGLLDPSGASPGGNRRYSEEDLARVERILELRNVMGFDLDRIGDILSAEDRLQDLKREVRAGVSKKRRGEILREAADINSRLQNQVAEKAEILAGFAAELRATRARYEALADELGIELPR
jgi:DNA-binding transcriptional MerR regulator